MADRPHQIQVRPQHRYDGGFKSRQNGPSPSKVLAILALLPIGGTLLCLAGITLTGTLIGLALTTPLFIICSPVVVPAAIVIGMAVAGFITSGAFGVTGLSSLSWVLNFLRGVGASVPHQMEEAKRRMQDVAAQMGEKTKEVGEAIQKKAQEAGK